MRHTSFLLSLAVTISLLPSADLNACGDKYLRLAARLGPAYVAEQPAAVLIYMPAGSAVPDVARRLGLQELLRRHGHRVQAVDREIDLERALARNRYDIVIADGAAAATLTPILLRGAGRPTLVPVFDKQSHGQMRKAQKTLPCLITSGEVAYHAVAEIDHVMDLRKSATVVP